MSPTGGSAVPGPGGPLVTFVGDVSLDTTVLVDHVPEHDEKVLTDRFVEDVGGVITNAAIACALWGAATRLHCAIASDAAGAMVSDAIRAHGVAISATSVPGQTTRAIVILDQTGEKRLVLSRGHTLYPPLEAVSSIEIVASTWVHTANYGGPATRLLLDRCLEQGVRFSLDLEPATLPATRNKLRELVEGARAVFVNDRSASLLGASGMAVLGAHVGELVETRGPRGALVTTAQGSWAEPAQASVDVVDTTGAGDALAGVYIARRTAGDSPEHALRVAVAVATLSVTRLGASASYPAPDDLSDHLVDNSLGHGLTR